MSAAPKVPAGVEGPSRLDAASAPTGALPRADAPEPKAEKLSPFETAVRERMALGLPRAQAEEAQRTQDAWDAEQAKAAKKSK